MAFAGDPFIPGCKPGFPPEVLQALPVFYFSPLKGFYVFICNKF